jgi:NADH pyrophosphatase NudC (nudix superfamily)
VPVAEYLVGEVLINENEIAEATWFARDEPLPNMPGTFSIAGHLFRPFFEYT